MNIFLGFIFINEVHLSVTNPTLESCRGDPDLINVGAAHPIRLASWGEGNGPITSGIRTDSTLLQCGALTRDIRIEVGLDWVGPSSPLGKELVQ